jgi:hypothetical protein
MPADAAAHSLLLRARSECTDNGEAPLTLLQQKQRIHWTADCLLSVDRMRVTNAVRKHLQEQLLPHLLLLIKV